jgi:hypothetical protein
MTEPIAPTAPSFHQQTGPLLIADISGYESFLDAVAVAHADDAFADGNVPNAYRMMSSLLDGIVTSVVPPFTLSKLEGDAVFAFARTDDGVPTGAAVMECIRGCYTEFRHRLAQAGDEWTCTCNACSRASALDLKFVLHAGRYVVQESAGSRELSGPDVVLTHRLLKSRAAEAVGQPAYALLTEEAATRLDVPVDDAVHARVRREGHAEIGAYVFALG